MGEVGDSINAGNAAWSFAGLVCETFDAHIEKSVPFYHEGHDLIVHASDFFVRDGSVVYDLGCSTGLLTERLLEHNRNKSIRMLAVDAIPEMLEKARGRCSRFANVEFLCEDLADLEMEPADLVVSYYTMQFVPPRCRGDVLGRVYSSLNWGGALALFEKVRAPDACFQDIGTALYSEFKLERGFSKAEILQKQRSLKGVLEPFSTAQNLALLERAGFRDVMTLLKYVCFEGYLAIKSPT